MADLVVALTAAPLTLQEHLFIVCELLRDNLYEFSRYNREQGAEPYFTIPRLRRVARQCLQAPLCPRLPRPSRVLAARSGCTFLLYTIDVICNQALMSSVIRRSSTSTLSVSSTATSSPRISCSRSKASRRSRCGPAAASPCPRAPLALAHPEVAGIGTRLRSSMSKCTSRRASTARGRARRRSRPSSSETGSLSKSSSRDALYCSSRCKVGSARAHARRSPS